MITDYLQQLHLPQPESHKGQNGKVLIIGGSELFHAASKWSLDIASKCVDMVFYSSVPSNNDLIREAKGTFWNGIVIERNEITNYIEEADCILIGPGMERTDNTEQLTNELVKKYPHKKWVIDAGALQMIDTHLLNEKCIVTPHYQELSRVFDKIDKSKMHNSFAFTDFMSNWFDGDKTFYPVNLSSGMAMSRELNGATLIVKGKVDMVADSTKAEAIEGGNAGMTKGGTGDVLAGLVAGLYCTNDAFTSAVVASYVNKKAGDNLYQNVGPYFNASDLVIEIPKVLWKEFQTYDASS